MSPQLRYPENQGKLKPSDREQVDRGLLSEIVDVHERSGGTYGSPRIHAHPYRRGIRVGGKRVERLMRCHGLQGAFLRRVGAAAQPGRTRLDALTPGEDFIVVRRARMSWLHGQLAPVEPVKHDLAPRVHRRAGTGPGPTLIRPDTDAVARPAVAALAEPTSEISRRAARRAGIAHNPVVQRPFPNSWAVWFVQTVVNGNPKLIRLRHLNVDQLRF